MSGASRILERLRNIKALGADRWVAGCPVCQSRKGRPVAIKLVDDGKILIHPFCGCASGDVMRSVGLRISDLFPPSNRDDVPTSKKNYQRMDAYQILVALEHELTVADLIACDVAEYGQFEAEQRARMHVVATRVSHALTVIGADRVMADIRRMVRARA